MKFPLFILIIFFGFVAPKTTQGQNFVFNADFELYSKLPKNKAQWDRCLGAYNLNGHFFLPWGTPDYFHRYKVNNGTSTVTWLPNTNLAYVYPQSGDAIFGLSPWADFGYEYREYIQMPLVYPLVVGTTYSISFYMTNGRKYHYSPYSSNHIGLLFSTDTLHQTNTYSLNRTPHVEIPGEIWDTNWTQYTFTFVADSAYNYMCFGNFHPDSLTTSTKQGSGVIKASYYFFDNFTVTSQTFDIQTTGNETICLGDSVEIHGYNDTSYAWADSLTPNIIFSNNRIIKVAPAQTTTYYVYGTQDTAKATVYVYPPPIIKMGNDTVICVADSFLLTPTINSAATLVWDDGSKGNSKMIKTTGYHWVEVTVGCTRRDSVFVEVLQCDYIMCKGDTIDLLGYNDPFISWANILYPSVILSNNKNFTVSPDSTSSYFIYGSTDTSLVNVLVYPRPQANLGSDTVICFGEGYLLDPKVNAQATLFWQDSTNTATKWIDTSGYYWVDITLGCTSRESVYVNVLECKKSICLGDSVTLFAYADANIAWANTLAPSVILSNNISIIVAPAQTTSYFVYGSTDTNIVTLTVKPLPIVNIGADTTICENAPYWIELNVDSATYLWNGYIEKSNMLISSAGYHWVEVTVNGCVSTDSIFVEIEKCDPELEMPNVFTPNGDGTNDLFIPVLYENITHFEIAIFNRWGDLVYTATNTNGWNGMVDGKEAADGVYMWMVKYTGIDKTNKELNGTVTLIR